MLMAAVVRELMAAGLEGDALVAALERIEQSAPPSKTARQERNARYYDKRLKASEKRLNKTLDPSVLKASESVLKRLNSDGPLPPSGPPKGGPSGGELSKDFEEWWRVYPRREARGHAEKAYVAARKLASQEILLAGARRYALSQPDPKYQKHPATWLNGRCWLDEPPDKPNGGGVKYVMV
jgi:hypothetical protein